MGNDARGLRERGGNSSLTERSNAKLLGDIRHLNEGFIADPGNMFGICLQLPCKFHSYIWVAVPSPIEGITIRIAGYCTVERISESMILRIFARSQEFSSILVEFIRILLWTCILYTYLTYLFDMLDLLRNLHRPYSIYIEDLIIILLLYAPQCAIKLLYIIFGETCVKKKRIYCAN